MNQKRLWCLWALVVVAIPAGLKFHVVEVVADSIGLLASVMMAYPFFRDDWMRATRTRLGEVRPADGGAANAIGQTQNHLEELLQRWRPEDLALMRSALLFLAASFALNTYAQFL
jgi:hypothetical protein